MAQLLVRNVDDKIVEMLKQRAASHGRSMEAELRILLEGVLSERPHANKSFAEKASELRKQISLPIDSLELIRDGRDKPR